MNKRIEVTAQVDENGQSVAVEIREDGQPLAHAIMEAPELEECIAMLSQARAMLADQVPEDLDFGTRLTALVDPRWRHPGSQPPEGKVLSLRHPGLGWITFVFPEHEAQAIADYLSADHPQTQ